MILPEKQVIVYSYPVSMSFVRNDEALLRDYYTVCDYYFAQVPSKLISSLLGQFWFLYRHRNSTSAYVSFFAGYSSVLPGLFAKLFGKPHLIILGGTDCVNFPEINYGNYRKRLLGWATRYSIQKATHLLPVDESLVNVDYSYMPVIHRKQGYENYCKGQLPPHTVIQIGYDESRFFSSEKKKPKSFLTVGQMNAANFYRKGVDLIFQVAEKFPDCTFTIVGHSENMQYPVPVPINVQLIPFVPYDQLREIYATHEFYFQLSTMEGFPSAPCEAMLCECVPIVSSVAALPNIVGDTGFVLKTKNLNDLVLLMHQALQVDTALYGSAARQRIINEFPKSLRLRIIDVINKCISNNSS